MAPKSDLYRMLAFAAAILCAVWTSSFLPSAGFLFLTANSVLAAYRSPEDLWTLAFVVTAYANLVVLFGCLRAYERAPELDVRRREILKLAILILSSTLNLSLTYHVSKILPFPLSVAVWSLSGVVVAAGFYLFYVHGGATHDGNFHTDHRGGESEKQVGAFLGGARDPARCS